MGTCRFSLGATEDGYHGQVYYLARILSMSL